MKLESNRAGRKLSARQPRPLAPFALLDQLAFNFFARGCRKQDATRAAKTFIDPPKKRSSFKLGYYANVPPYGVPSSKAVTKSI